MSTAINRVLRGLGLMASKAQMQRADAELERAEVAHRELESATMYLRGLLLSSSESNELLRQAVAETVNRLAADQPHGEATFQG